MKTCAEGSGLLFQGGGLRSFLVEDGSSSTDPLLSSGSRFEEVGLLLELLAALGIGGAQGGRLCLESHGGGKGGVTDLGGGGGRRDVGRGAASLCEPKREAWEILISSQHVGIRLDVRFLHVYSASVGHEAGLLPRGDATKHLKKLHVRR
ncbi:hypothetical protein GUJ93_ZPchr0458g22677 [Zizania palustris]|uniref:Uncharacterized protein n=1 Tax=Zizania palustris TaxID=103762 RepID=A0A8J5R010_ZIZPA|nr:hypothetical protein GUJ93_ZPchr0458g22677 [Zizania palustris]